LNKMENIKPDNSSLLDECRYSASRAGGPGGQNVNKVNTKVELKFNIPGSKVLSSEQKELLMEKLRSRINSEGDLVLSSREERSQPRNKELVSLKFLSLLEKALRPVKKRIPGKPTIASVEKRIENKIRKGRKKRLRNSPETE